MLSALITFDLFGLLAALAAFFAGQALAVYEFAAELSTDADATRHVNHIVDALALDVAWRRGVANFGAALALAFSEKNGVVGAVAVLLLVGNALYLLFRGRRGADAGADRPSTASYAQVAQAMARDADLFPAEDGVAEEKNATITI